MTRLEALAAPSPVAWFVLLATYYAAELTRVENILVRDNLHPLRVSEPPSCGVGPAELAACLHELRGLAAGSALFHRYALGLLRALDRTLADVPSFALVPEVAIGCDGRAYRVRRLINPIADHAHLGLPPSARQGTLAAYARRMKLVPADIAADTLGGRSIECLDLQASQPAVYKRLLDARDRLCVVLAPLNCRIEYGSLTSSAADADGFVLVKDPRNEAEILEQVRAAVEAAARARAALLVFPELALSPPVLAGLCEHLASGVTNGYPILTVAGLCHAPLSGEHVNTMA